MKKQKGHIEQLNDVQALFMELAGCFIHGEKSAVSELPDGLGELADFSAIHKLSPAVFEVLRTSLPQEVWADSPIWKKWKGRVISQVISQAGRTEAFLNVYQKLVEAGVKPLVVKGIVCRSLYEKSDYRVSSDEDVLVQAVDAAVCDRILLEEGFRRGELDFDNLPHEIGYRNPITGVYLELHFSLFDENGGVFGRLNEAFDDGFERAVSVCIQNVDVWTLHPTKHLLYLLCHCYKHFLFSGFGVRQVCDIVMMAEKWGSDIDWSYLNEQIQEFQMECFWEGLLHIGYGWLHMNTKVYDYAGKVVPTADEAKENSFDLLQDILAAGIYGSSTKERQHSANVTLAAAKKENAVLRSLFPGKDYLKAHYSFAEKHPILLPAAWGMRIGKYLLGNAKKKPQEPGVKAESSLQIGKKRVELIRKYGLMK